MKIVRLFLPALAGLLAVSWSARAQFATSVVSYNSGTGFAANFTNPAVALGKPAATTSVTPLAPAFSSSQLVSLGTNGSLTLQFNPPIVHFPSNPYGLDFQVYGNSFFINTGGGVTSGLIGGNNPGGTRVEVSADGSNWFTLNPALTPTVDSYYPTDGPGDPGIPVNPALTASDFNGKNLAGIRSLYAGSAGGGGFNLAWAQDTNGNPIDLSIARFVRLDVLTNKSEVDAVSEVRPTLPGFAEDFFTDPALDGWSVFGPTNLFHWNSTNQNLEVTWDSSQSNAYFFHPLGTTLSRDDDFQISFDIELFDILAGVNPDKPDAIEVAVGFLNYADATGAFVRGAPAYPVASPDPKNLVEFDYFPYFVDPFAGPIEPSISPTMVSSAYQFDGAFGDFFTFTNNSKYTVHMSYTAVNQTLTTTVTPAGQTNALIVASSTLSGTNDFRADTFSITSYTDIGDPYDSLLAHGTIDNVIVTLPPPPIQKLAGSVTNNTWQAQFASRSNWVYTLQRTADFNSWTPASAPITATGTNLTLQDTNSPTDKAFYRVSAARP